jgi:hypothetical protein
MKRNILFFLAISFVFIGCATGPSPDKEPVPQVTYSFSFEPPERAAKKCGVTIGIVSPQWDKNIGIGQDKKIPWFDAGISPDPMELLTYPNLMAHTAYPPNDVVAISLAFQNAVKKEFEGMLIARGFDVMGPFNNTDEMTYPQKTACNLVIIPEFSQVIQSKPTTVNLDTIEGTAVARTEVVLNVYDPMSKEKLWMKRFTHTSDPFPYKTLFYAEYVIQGGQKVGVQRKGIAWDNRAANFAHAEESLFKDIMQKAWSYFNTEEMMVLKNHSDELRTKKRF